MSLTSPSLFEQLGLTKVEPMPVEPGLPPRIEGRRGRRVVRVYEDRIGAPRSADLRGRLAEMLVREHALKQAGTPVAAIRVPTFGPALWAEAVAFIDRYAPHAGVGLMDATDRLALHAPSLQLHRTPPRAHPTPATAPEVSLFTDLNRWLLKVLLLRAAPPRHAPPTLDPIETQTDLARVAQVSLATAHRLWSALEHQQYLVYDPSLRLARVPALLASWIALDAVSRPASVHVRPLIASDDTLAVLARTPGLRWALTATAAAERHGVRHQFVHAAAPEILVEGDPDAACRAAGLARCAPHESTALLTRAEHPESVFRAVRTVDDVPVVDILQAGLDAARQPMLGQAQAEHIAHVVAGWHAR